MKYQLLVLLSFLWIGFNAQISEPNFKEIRSNLDNPESVYYYDKILFKFKGLPKILGQEEAQHLYYARQFKGNLVSTSDDDFKTMVNSFSQNNNDQTINQALKLLSKDPTNLDLLMIIVQVYRNNGDQNNFIFRLNQFRLLVEAIKSSGDGKSQKTPFVVNSVGDEYVLLSVLNIDINAYTRSSKTTKGGMLDIWSKGDDHIYIKVAFPAHKF